MFGREVVEGEQRAPVLLQAFGGLLVLDPIGLDEDVERRLAVSRPANTFQIAVSADTGS